MELNEEKIGLTYKVLFDHRESSYFMEPHEPVNNEVLVPHQEHLRAPRRLHRSEYGSF
jgi:hypothetical protein